MKRKDGEPRSDYVAELDDMILDLLLEKKMLNVDRVRKGLNEKYSRKLGWLTIKRHLDRMMEKELIKICYESGEGKKKLRVYKLDNNSKIISLIVK